MAESKSQATAQGGIPPDLDYKPRIAAPQAEEAPRPAIRCPNCRQLNPIVDYGELAYYEQPFDTESGDWTSDGGELVGETDGSATIIAKCGRCEYDMTTYLLRWSQKHPNHAPYAGFVHEVHVPRGIPIKRTASPRRNPILATSDKDLDALIADSTRALGAWLDEREERRAQRAREAARRA